MYMKKQTLPEIPQYLIDATQDPLSSISRGHDHGWDFEEWEPNAELLGWLKSNVNATATWKLNVSERTGNLVRHVETEPKAGMKFAYFTEIHGDLLATWMEGGRVVYQEPVQTKTWYVMRMDVEHVAL